VKHLKKKPPILYLGGAQNKVSRRGKRAQRRGRKEIDEDRGRRKRAGLRPAGNQAPEGAPNPEGRDTFDTEKNP